MATNPPSAPALIEHISDQILILRGQRVMLSFHLAKLYLVEPRTLIQSVKRNPGRFPNDFMFQLTLQEVNSLKSQFVISKPSGRGGPRTLPYAFTEQGIAMLSSVLRSDRAIQVNVEIMRAFVHLRQLLASNKELAKKLAALEEKHDAQFKVVFDAIRAIMTPSEKTNGQLGLRLGKIIGDGAMIHRSWGKRKHETDQK